MGTWAVGSFGNDAAGDWVIDLAGNPTYGFLRQTLQESIDAPGDSDTNSCAIAAAEVLCIVGGQLPGDYEEVAHNLLSPVALLQQQPVPVDLPALAVTCLKSILADSELKELWEDDQEWTADIQRLISQLEAR